MKNYIDSRTNVKEPRIKTEQGHINQEFRMFRINQNWGFSEESIEEFACLSTDRELVRWLTDESIFR
ncbi:MAG: hypothetical protein IIB44_03190 [Candidatus Marinimicrobia bacterium]|nr:hypothetical protein [Candidatus Neomarinimicrobiota bacterium]MCH8069339.1 hypothetical protein [Candidatus Neomarinimicrobiota bacterium]